MLLGFSVARLHPHLHACASRCFQAAPLCLVLSLLVLLLLPALLQSPHHTSDSSSPVLLSFHYSALPQQSWIHRWQQCCKRWLCHH
jgi:hypothetical protein